MKTAVTIVLGVALIVMVVAVANQYTYGCSKILQTCVVVKNPV